MVSYPIVCHFLFDTIKYMIIKFDKCQFSLYNIIVEQSCTTNLFYHIGGHYERFLTRSI